MSFVFFVIVIPIILVYFMFTRGSKTGKFRIREFSTHYIVEYEIHVAVDNDTIWKSFNKKFKNHDEALDFKNQEIEKFKDKDFKKNGKILN